ncbi:aldo/keto reductase [Chlorogloeopsis fritschii PCC 9212]|uniref:Aldo/keto reductase n=1 Tax=Chlorogloeopsis fritschii PCC 6912 TaxID=211165 RepID=A0A3S0ZBP6_CHLFR|nr:aldo/keto reductase [Chlorogloeopsis fritschii]MBF2006980.1 aldo/keto reductase [Chlorogloeopsis fritschii C42_A2020_084]RUR73038.1 aldo/keto reductase [Chlorogloeopsis fritschii PCC 6912]
MSFERLNQINDYRQLGNTNLYVSPFCLGTMSFGTDWGWGADRAESYRMFSLYVERGGNFIDTANHYTNGTSETFLGEFIGNLRDRLIVGTHYSVFTQRGDANSSEDRLRKMVQSLETSLRRLRTDYIDIYWIHHWVFGTPIEDVMRVLDQVVRSGKILYVGVSNTPAWKIAQGNAIAQLRGWSPFIGVQVEYNLINRMAERDIIPMANDLQMGFVATSPLAGGILTGKYNQLALARQISVSEMLARIDCTTARASLNQEIGRLNLHNLAISLELMEIARQIDRSPAQVALNWLLQQSDITSTILGARTSQQLEENLGSVEFQLDMTQIADVDAINPTDSGMLYGDTVYSEVQDILLESARVVDLNH